jgi:hypothetical protein
MERGENKRDEVKTERLIEGESVRELSESQKERRRGRKRQMSKEERRGRRSGRMYEEDVSLPVSDQLTNRFAS